MVEKTSKLKVTTPTDLEIVMTRMFDAPRRLVFEAMTKPEHLVHWWGPHGHTMAVCEVDLRPGGAYRFVNRDAEGNEHPFKGVYREIVPPEKLVFTQIYDVELWSIYETTITSILTEMDGKTTLTSTLVFNSVEERDGMIASGMESGAAETYERLDQHLRSMAKH